MDRVCRTCLRIINSDHSVTYLSRELSDSSAVSLRHKLEVCVPELTLDIVINPTICDTCSSALVLAYQFKTKCIQTEKTLYNCIQQRKKKNIDFTDLLNVDDLLILARKYISREHSYSYMERSTPVDIDTSDSSDEEGSDDSSIKLSQMVRNSSGKHTEASNSDTDVHFEEKPFQGDAEVYSVVVNEIEVTTHTPNLSQSEPNQSEQIQSEPETMETQEEYTTDTKVKEKPIKTPIKKRKSRRVFRTPRRKLSAIRRFSPMKSSPVSFKENEILKDTTLESISSKEMHKSVSKNESIVSNKSTVPTELNQVQIEKISMLSDLSELLPKSLEVSKEILLKEKESLQLTAESRSLSRNSCESMEGALVLSENEYPDTSHYEVQSNSSKSCSNITEKLTLQSLNRSIQEVILKLQEHHETDCGMNDTVDSVDSTLDCIKVEKAETSKMPRIRPILSFDGSGSSNQFKTPDKKENESKKRRRRSKLSNLPKRQINIKRSCRSNTSTTSNPIKRRRVIKLSIDSDGVKEIPESTSKDAEQNNSEISKSKKFMFDKSYINNTKENFLEFINNNGTEQYECTVCGKIFSFKCHLDIHMQTHASKFTCPVCKKEFDSGFQLKSHELMHINNWQCEICNKYLSSATALKRHVATHTGERPFKCELCGKRFAQDIQRQVHLRVHTGSRPFGCNLCEAAFKQKSHLVGHTRIHTGEKPYKCELCPRKFRKPYALHIHKDCHDKKPFQCKSCNYLVKEIQTFERHLHKHLVGTLPLKTDKPKDIVLAELKEDLKNVVLLRNIKQKDYQVGMFYCDICNKGFATNYNKMRHKVTHH